MARADCSSSACTLADKAAFKTFLEPLYHTRWHVYAKPPFAGPHQVLAYLARYTHRVAISNSRLIKADETGITFRYKDYRIKGPGRYKTMTLAPAEFIRRSRFMSCQRAFTASATTACWRAAAPRPRRWHAPAS